MERCEMTQATATVPTCQAGCAASLDVIFLLPFVGFLMLGYCVAGAILDRIDSGRPNPERTAGTMSRMRETCR